MIRFRISQRYYPIVVAIQFLTHVLDKISEKKPKNRKKNNENPYFYQFLVSHTKKEKIQYIYIYKYISKKNIHNKFKKIIGASVDKKN